MSDLTIKDFTAIYTELCAVYDKPINELRAIAYYKHISKYKYSYEEVLKVVNDWIENSDGFPSLCSILSDLRENIKISPKKYNARQIGDGDFIPEPESIKDIIGGMKNIVNKE
jgi:hypothetical protein